MLSKNYLSDGFILHAETIKLEKTNEHIYLKNEIEKKTKKQKKSKQSIENLEVDPRHELSFEWANFHKTFRYQPLLKVY